MTTESLYMPPELIVIMDPDARDTGGELTDPAKSLTHFLDSEQAVLEPLFGVTEKVDAMAPLMGRDQPLDLSIFNKVTGPVSRFESIAPKLREFSFVQAAYLKPAADIPGRPERAENTSKRSTLDDPPKDFTGLQGYLKSAKEGGIDAEFAWKQDGGYGTGVKIIDIEGAWNFLHEDLVDNPSSCVAGVSIRKRIWRRHGTAVLGMLAGDHNKFGINGICPESKVSTVSIFDNEAGDPSPTWGSAKAIKTAADMLDPGDILLLELHRPGPAVCFQENEQTQEGYIPVEWWPCDLAAILYANRRGIIVVEAGGNGQQNLDDKIYDENPAKPNGPFPSWWVNPFRRQPIDSKAIIVGAGLPPLDTSLGPDGSREEHSNFGSVIDTQGWGIEVATTGFNNDLGDDLDPENRHYTARFNGTSSAAAMITGALGCLQGILKKKGKILTPLEARTLLSDNRLGTPQQAGPLGPARLEPIGPRPDLRRLIEHF